MEAWAWEKVREGERCGGGGVMKHTFGGWPCNSSLPPRDYTTKGVTNISKDIHSVHLAFS